MMETLFVLRRHPPYGGGAERQACLLQQELCRLGQNAWLVAGRLPGVSIGREKAILVSDSVKRFWGTILFHVSLLCLLERNRRTLQVIHTFFPNETTLLLLVWARCRHKRLIYKVSGAGKYGDLARTARSARARLVWWFLTHTRGVTIVSVSDAMTDEVTGSTGRAELRTIPNGVASTNAPQRISSKGELKMLCIGRLSPEKGFDLAIDALGRISDARLVIAGDGPMRSNLTVRVGQLGLQNRVRFVGHSDDLSDLYAQADLVVVPSQSEGLSNVMLEAMAHGVPVVSTPVSGASDVITDGENGFIADNHTVDALVAKIRQFQGLSSTMRDEMSSRAVAMVQSNFDIRHVATEYMKVYDDVWH